MVFFQNTISLTKRGQGSPTFSPLLTRVGPQLEQLRASLQGKELTLVSGLGSTDEMSYLAGMSRKGSVSAAFVIWLTVFLFYGHKERRADSTFTIKGTALFPEHRVGYKQDKLVI